MNGHSWRKKFWLQWIAANAIGELLGLGTVAGLGFLAASHLGEPHGMRQSLMLAALFLLLGAFEGLVVGLAQSRVLLQRLPGLRGWVQATVVGAVAAWTLGMAPSTIMSITQASTSIQPPQISEPVRLLLAAGLGLVAGPLLAFFQWRCLRQCVTNRSAWWLPANALAWALGMPVIFIGAHTSAFTSSPVLIALSVAGSLLAAGAVVGAIHGRVLVWLLSEGRG